MKNFLSLFALSLLSAGVFIACSDDESDSYECSDEEYTPAAGGAGGAGGEGGGPGAMCEAPEAPTETIEIAGSYTDGFFDHVITADSWNSTNFSYVNNEENYALGRNDEDDEYNPCAWSKFVWLEEDGKLYYCQNPFNAQSECAAQSTEDPDASDLMNGCNGFAWSKLIAE